MTGLRRRAKYGLIDTDRGDTLVFHLGMSGHWRVDPSAVAKHDHFLLETDEGRRVALNDARRFGSLDLVRPELDQWPPFKALGPEPLDLDPGALRKSSPGGPPRSSCCCSTSASSPASATSMPARRCRWDPSAPGRGSVSLERLKRLVRAIHDVLAEGDRGGRLDLRDFVAPDGELGYFSKSFAVYDREGQPCGCGEQSNESCRAGARLSIARSASTELT